MIRFATVGGLVLALSLCASADDKKGLPKELEPFQGTWKVAEASRGGQPAPKEAVETLRFKFEGDKLIISEKDDSKAGSYSINAKKEPAEIDLVSPDGKKAAGIYKFEKDGKLRLAFVKGEDARPKGFDNKDATLMVLEKVK